MAIDESTLDRIAKLLRLASDKGATQDEAATALSMAHKILESHNLSMDEVDQHQSAVTKAEQVGHQDIPVGKWEVLLFNTIALHNYCKVLRMRRYDLRLIGRPTNIAATKMMFEWINRQGNAFYVEEWTKHPQYGIMNWRTFKAGFYRGFTARISARLRAEKPESATALAVTSMAMVRVNENDAYMPSGKARPQAKRSFSNEAVSAGYRRGADASLMQRKALS